MKVYFEISGGGSDGKGNMVCSIKIYVNPTQDGHAYHFDALGKEYQFAWANPKRAWCYESSELPKALWQSIQHGTWHAEIPAEKKNNWTLDDLKYERVKMPEVKAWKEVCDKIDSVETLDDFKALYPTLKESNRNSMAVILKLFSICGVDVIPEHNGEMGIAFMLNYFKFKRLLIQLGIE